MTDRLERWLASDFVTRLLGWATLMVVVAMMVLAGLTIPRVVSNTEASRRTDNLASCRAALSAGVAQERDRVLDAQGDIISDMGLAVVNAIRQDPVALDTIARQLIAHEEARVEAQARLREVRTAYAEAVELSQTDPDLFIARCKDQ